ncbi:signal peptidase I [Candidatus Roizmanbacteria bacterium CG_4_9_14_0_2_um_filter_39_13]|uniref:Signal peptidase I n=1 Tax=Candidatus Roizmanbacteria bacterium CG_4_9_14_0_2_um_filter_39_13 TaxID=1974839 RepID=A0A2M8EZ79_9BACT|nr:MAG: signal peptidase I [Candidatus Roizmanbacteria bacterium CG_4_10_14_0_2_um_filter_39_12]PJC32205.1 MAG: signal peptidase I [Candidatus Roizmanbacteria bacterium CG_4_9_14_0_2_um_filter_39_13]
MLFLLYNKRMNILKGIIAFIMEIMETVVFVGSLFIVIYLFILQPNQIKGASMEPTFYNGNYIFTSKITYKMRAPHRGDVVVFHSPKNHDIEFIKRIIGLPGDTVLIEDNELYVNGKQIPEQYISEKTTLVPGSFAQNGVPIIVPEEQVFVMGDNRPRSSDSREFGTIDEKSIVGQVFYRYFPTDKIGSIENPYDASGNLKART